MNTDKRRQHFARRIPDVSHSEAGRQSQDVIGTAWEKHLGDKSYGSIEEDARFLGRFRASPYIRIILQYAKLAPGSLILEPGCGSGKFGISLASLGHRTIALDYVASVLHGIQATERRLRGQWSGRFSAYCQGSIEHLPFREEAFDLVLNEGVVEHWLEDEDRLAVLQEMVRVTKAGGVMAVLVPNGVHPLIHKWEKQLEGLQKTPPMIYYGADRLRRELIEAGLQDVHTDGIYPWRSWLRLPPWNRFYLLGAALDRWVPLRSKLRASWAINLIGIGCKK